jgi:hypothetical protein
MMNPYQKLKTWWQNKLFLFHVKKGLIKRARKKYPNPPSLITKLSTALATFWLKNWRTLAIIIVMLIGIGVTIFVHYDTK